MNVMLLEHQFGREISTSQHQLFTYFCNNFYLGQWQAAKACLKQLHACQTNFKFDLDSLLLDLIEHPEFYCQGSYTIQTPFHMSLLLYEFCLEQNYLKPKDEQFYDKLRLKSLIYQLDSECDSLYKESPTRHEIKVSISEPDSSVRSSNLMTELMGFLHLKETPQVTANNLLTCETVPASQMESKSISGSKSVASSFNDKLSTCSHTMSELSTSQNSLSDLGSGADMMAGQLSTGAGHILQNLFVHSPHKARCICELIFKHNRLCQNVFLKGKSESL